MIVRLAQTQQAEREAEPRSRKEAAFLREANLIYSKLTVQATQRKDEEKWKEKAEKTTGRLCSRMIAFSNSCRFEPSSNLYEIVLSLQLHCLFS